MKNTFYLLVCSLFLLSFSQKPKKYTKTEHGIVYQTKSDSIDPKMDWWKEAKFGMFIHWGLYAVPAGNWGNEKTKVGDGTEWIQCLLKIPVADYKPLVSKFNPVKYNAEEWVLLAKEAGMKYIILTAKHHDGFAMFKSADPFNIVDATPYGKDVVKALADACKKHGMHFGLYYSQAQDWTHPGGAAMMGHWDKAQEGSFDKYLDEVAVPQVKEILSAYNPEIIWWDTPTDMTKERAAKFAPILSKYPKLITNNRLGGGVDGDLDTPEQHIPATGIPGKNWESCMTMNGTWGYSVNDHNWKSTETLVRNLIDIASKGGNYLLNVGPDELGLIPQPSVERLKAVGKWMKVNGEAIYGASANPFDDIQWGRVTQKKSGKNTKLYLHVFDWPTDGKLFLTSLDNKIAKAYPLASPQTLLNTGVVDFDKFINLSGAQKMEFATVIVVEITGTPSIIGKPEIKAESSIFIDKMFFEISSDFKNGVIYYTTDGSNPTIKSQVAKGKIEWAIKGNLIVKARTFLNEIPVSRIAVREFKRETPLTPVFESKPGLKPGLKSFYYKGLWFQLPDFSKLTPEGDGIVENIGISEKKQANEYGIVFEGFINVPETNLYTFYLSSDDGSRLTIDDLKILDNDGVHAMKEESMDLALSAGLHKICVQFFQLHDGDGLKVEWKPAGKVKSEIDKSLFFH